MRPNKHNEKTNNPDGSDRRVGFENKVWNFTKQFERFTYIWLTPKATGTCFAIMITPMAANIPCTAAVGKKTRLGYRLERYQRELGKRLQQQPLLT